MDTFDGLGVPGRGPILFKHVKTVCSKQICTKTSRLDIANKDNTSRIILKLPYSPVSLSVGYSSIDKHGIDTVFTQKIVNERQRVYVNAHDHMFLVAGNPEIV